MGIGTYLEGHGCGLSEHVVGYRHVTGTKTGLSGTVTERHVGPSVPETVSVVDSMNTVR